MVCQNDSSYAELEKQVQRMADVVSAALRWREDAEVISGSSLQECDCSLCSLKNAVDRYIKDVK